MKPPVRLDPRTRPNHYTLDLDIDLDRDHFAGTVTIALTAEVATSEIRLHAAGLHIQSVTLIDGSGTSLAVKFHQSNEDLIVETDPVVGQCELKISYSGTIGDNLAGFYRSTSHVEEAVVNFGVTQFEPANARRAFPCFDEPACKARFDITITTDASLSVISNGRLSHTEYLDGGRCRRRFATTIPMSTYLVAWVIGAFESSSVVHVGETPIQIHHAPGRSGTAFALRVAEHALRWFEDYYAIPYPGDSLDLVAVPDFAFGAMENMGCVTFRESLLLLDESNSTTEEQIRLAEVVAHEIAHMWFGNLVTMEWWNEIWLNEAFATLMELKCADAFEPSWDVWTRFAVARASALSTDCLDHTRPIENAVVTPDDAEAMFDVLTYEKGCGVLRMFEQWMGETAFRDGVRRYLARHAYANTTAPDLWAALSDGGLIDFGDMLGEWIHQRGYPAISVHPTEAGFELHQRRHLLTGQDATTWKVPVSVAIGTEHHPISLPSRHLVVPLPLPTTANRDAVGFYRVVYEDAAFEGFVESLASRPMIEQFAAIDDYWSFLLAGRIDPIDLHRVLDSLDGASFNTVVWQRVSSLLWTAHNLGLPELFRRQQERIVHDFTEVSLQRASAGVDLEWVAAIWTAMLSGEVDEPTRQRIASFVNQPELQQAALLARAHNNDAADFTARLDRANSTANPQEEQRLLLSLTQFTSPAIVDRLFEACISTIRTQTAPLLVGRALCVRENQDRLWDLIESRWEDLTSRFPTMLHSRMLTGIGMIGQRELGERVDTFLRAHPLPSATTEIDQRLDLMHAHISLAERLAPSGRG